MLYVFGGLPGVGKSTLARQVALARGAVYLRIDTIEQAIRMARPAPPGAAGYLAAQALAADNLSLGRAVVADAVNALEVARAGWRRVARQAACPLQPIEVLCSDPVEHRRRVEARSAPIPGLLLPTWAQVQQRRWEPWTDAGLLVIDTAGHSPEESGAALLARLGLA